MKTGKLSPFEKILIVVAIIFCAIILMYSLLNKQPVEIIQTSFEENTFSTVSSESASSTSSTYAVANSIDLNTATPEQLKTIKGVGDVMAERIIAYRNEIGQFSDVEQLKNVSGIGDAKFNTIKEYVFVQ